MLTEEKSKPAAPLANKEQLRRELLRLILKSEAQRKSHKVRNR